MLGGFAILGVFPPFHISEDRMRSRWGFPAFVCALAVAVLLFIPSHLWALLPFVQDSTATQIPSDPKHFVIFYFLANIVPLITAWITKKYNAGTGWFAMQSNGVKMAVYVLGTVVAMYAWQAVGLVFDPNALDITNLGADVVDKFVKAGVGTLLVKTGIQSAKTVRRG
jgi:hypothetical protein